MSHRHTRMRAVIVGATSLLLGLFSAACSSPSAPRGTSHAPALEDPPRGFPVIRQVEPAAAAKRSPPEGLPPVTFAGIRYAVPHFRAEAAGMLHNGGYLEDVRELDGKRLWLLEVYRYTTLSDLERDLQEVFIVSLKLEGSSLILRDENGAEYRLNPRGSR